MTARVGIWIMLVATSVITFTGTASAHGLGDGAELPVDPMWIAWGAGAVVVASFVLFGITWSSPALQTMADGRRLPGAVTRGADIATPIARVFAAAVFVITVGAAFSGSRFAVLNVAPWVVFIGIAVVMPVLSFVLGDIWRAVSPLRTLAAVAQLAGTRLGITQRRSFTDWPAVVALAGFSWLELAYHDSASPKTLGWLLLGYTVWAVVPATIWGTDWTDKADGIGWWFSAVASMSPITRSTDGLHVRPPFVGASTFRTTGGSAIALLIVVGATTFDGVGRTTFWGDVMGGRSGWDATGVRTLGLIWTISMVAALYLGGSRRTDRFLPNASAANQFLPALLPVAFGYAIAHTFAALIFDGQTLLIRASDPFGNGSDWFGTAGWIENTTLIAAPTIAWIQIAAVVIGHVAATMIAHDRAVAAASTRDKAMKSQYSMVLVMVVFTTAGLLLLVDG